MGMDYVPVYEGEEPQGPEVKISLDKVQKLGVRTEAAAYRNLARGVRALGTVQVSCWGIGYTTFGWRSRASSMLTSCSAARALSRWPRVCRMRCGRSAVRRASIAAIASRRHSATWTAPLRRI